MSTTDPRTGLPELPEGYFWRFGIEFLDGSARLDIRKRRVIGSTRDFSTYLESPVDQNQILEEAKGLLEIWNQIRVEKSLVGDYPPKKLEETE